MWPPGYLLPLWTKILAGSFYICQQPFIATERPALVIALPHGPFFGKLPNRLIRFGKAVAKLLPTHDVSFSCPVEAGEAHALNLLIDEFRLEPKNEWFFLWDTKVEITAENLVTLIQSRVGVVGALYANKAYEPKWMAAFFPDMKASENGLLAVPELDAGAKLYHRTVFDEIERKGKVVPYIFDQSGRSLPAFCQETLVNFGEYKRILRPANYLDWLCRESGIGIFAHIGVIIAKGKGPYRPWEHTRLPPPECAEELPEAPHDPRPITVILQYCDKDKALANSVAERIWINSSVEVILQYSAGNQYPKGPNEAAIGTIRLLENSAAKAVLLIEPDCCPVTPDWLEQLSASWDRASAAGKLIMGSWHPVNMDHPTLGHINGNLMFSPDLAKRITIPDVPPDKPWDTFLADVFQPHWCRTGLIKNLNRHRTASLAQLTKPECGNRPPVLIHGVRDESAWNLAKQNATPVQT